MGEGGGGGGLVGEGGDFVADAVLVFAGERGQALAQEEPFGGAELGQVGELSAAGVAAFCA